jgi:hypothetical protein
MAVTETVKIVFEVDDKQVTDSVAELAKLGKVSQEDAAKFKQLGDASKAAGASMSTAAKGAKDLSAATADVGKSAQAIGSVATAVKTTSEEFVPLRTRLRDAKNELAQLEESFGSTSQEAFEARQRVGELTARLDDLNRQTKLIEPEDKIKAFSRLGQGIVGAFSVATGALQAFGAENEEVQKVAQKLQGALNIVQGVQSIIELKEAYEDIRSVLGFTTVAQNTLTTAQNAGTVSTNAGSAAMKGFAASLSATGIGAIVVALGALVGALILTSDSTDDSVESTDEYKEALGKLKKAQEEATISELRLAQSRAKDPKEKERIEQQIVAIQNQGKINALKGEESKINEDIAKKQADLLNTDLLLAQGNLGAAAFEGIKNFFSDTKDEVKALEAQSKLTNETIAKESETLSNEEIQRREEANAKIKKDEDDAAKKAVEDAKKNAKEIEEARLKALQDNQANIDATYAAEQSRRQQFEQELASQLGDIDKAAQQKRLNNEITFFGDQAAISEENLKDEIQQAQDRADKVAEFYGKDSNAYQAELEKKRLLELQFGKLVVDNRQKALNEANASALIQNQIDATSAEDLLARNNKTQEKYLRDSVALYKEGTDERKAAEQALALFLKKLGDDQLADDKAKAKERTEIAKQAADESINFILDLQSASFEREQQELEEQKEKGIITEEQYQEKLKQLKLKQARANKEAAIFQATTDFALALINALTFKPANAVPAALVLTAALAGANLAKVIATPLPKFKQGTLAVPGYDTGDDSVMAMLRPGEAVIPTETNREYSAIIRSIYKREIPASELNEFIANRNKPVFDFNAVTLDALYKRDIRTSALNNAVMKRTGGEMPTFKVKADVDTYALSRAMAKNKGVDVNNADYLAQAIASELKKGINPRQLL